jgi:hypothetical protein
MKMKLLCIFLFGCAAPLLGQQAVPAPSMAPLPPGPLLKRTPDYSTWTVTSKGTPLPGGASATSGTAGGGRDQQKESPVAQLTVVKTGSTTLEYHVHATGERDEIWHVADIRVMIRLVGDAKPLVCPDYGGGDIYSTNFAVSDFAGLDWVSADTYSGMAKHQERDCIVFKSNVSPLDGQAQKLEAAAIAQERAVGKHPPDPIKVPAVAFIDLDTRLPVYVQFGGEKCTYQYGPPPRAPLQLPAQLAGSAIDYQQRIKGLSAPASRPF